MFMLTNSTTALVTQIHNETKVALDSALQNVFPKTTDEVVKYPTGWTEGELGGLLRNLRFAECCLTHAGMVHDGDMLDLLGCPSFLDYLQYLKRHTFLHTYSVMSMVEEGATYEAWSPEDVVRAAFDESNVEFYCASKRVSSVSLFNEWCTYLVGDGSYGVFSEYWNFCDMWGAERVLPSWRGHLFLEVLYSYERERIVGPSVAR